MSTHEESTKLTGIGFIDNIFFDHNINRYGISAMLLLVVGCMGGIAVGLGALESTIQLAFLAFSTMFALSMIIAVVPMRTIVYACLAAILIDLIIILINLF